MGFIADEFFKREASAYSFPFGIVSKEELAAALRKFADGVEAGNISLLETRVITRAKTEEFLISSLILRYIERRC